MKFRLVILLVIVYCQFNSSVANNTTASEINDSSVRIVKSPIILESDTINDSIKIHKVWYRQLIDKRFNLKDTTIRYPRFVKFCVDVYNWADKTFNSYNSEYVVGTGHKWKVMLRNENWMDSYAMRFNHKVPINMISDPSSDIGAYLSFMAVSVGYALNFNNLIWNKPIEHKKLEFNFSCALFSADAYFSQNDGGTKIRRFGDFENKKFINYNFPDLKLKSYGIDAYYFFNNKKYSQGAAYNYSKYQLRSAGSVILGLSLSHQKIIFDFTTLPTEMQQYLPEGNIRTHKFHYNDYCLLLGYGYNCVMGKHWLFNATALPSIGFKHSFHDSIEGSLDLFSMNIKGKLSFVYNLKDFFCSFIAKMDGHWYLNGNYSLFNSIEIFSFTTGFRF